MNTNEKLKRYIKSSLALLLYYTGVLKIYRFFVLRNKAIILVYHRIVNDPNDLSDYSSYGITVNETDFRRQIHFLSKAYNIIKLSELVSIISDGGNIPDRACIITFDDGWKDNYTNAYPILKHYRVPATIFLATNFINNKTWFWEERIKYLLAHYHDCVARNSIDDKEMSTFSEFLTQYSIEDFTQLESRHLSQYLTGLTNRFRENSENARNQFMHDLERIKNLHAFKEPRRFMEWSEIQNMNEEIISIGGHTNSHLPLQSSSKEVAITELVESKKTIENMLARKVDLFAYPYGKFNDQTPELVRESGYSCACTLSRGYINADTNLFKLKRVDIYQDIAPNIPYFECRILGFMNLF